ncbi:hypothetical protein SAMN04487969_11972 [Paenibacillus algorifonticola]|uniref:Uncharacterized protein n=1 Tax=Paenibacillus algorifonticola TaxID=684063 RepID=A0A1I2H2S3_9BACL|nr:hypothetical protein [Paenibacillus algorifonticola]SFF23106.1 hypothetical protein SAMN04487969_11972 [Paenibacillus algorifonticola]
MSSKTKNEAHEVAEAPPVPAYSKEQYLTSKRFSPQERDILAAVLEANRSYTNEEAVAAIESYLRKDVR